MMEEPKLVPCKHIFSNGMEHELFCEKCYKCKRFRNGKCRIFTAIMKAMFDEKYFPYDDLLEWSGGYGGKVCRCFTDEPIPRKPRKNRSEIEGQVKLNDNCIENHNDAKAEYMDCFKCGGKDTVKFVRSEYNGHKHGRCVKCGTLFME